MGVSGWGLEGSEISQYLVLKHFLTWPETVLFLNEVFWYLYTIYIRQIDFILRLCLFSVSKSLFENIFDIFDIFTWFSISVIYQSCFYYCNFAENFGHKNCFPHITQTCVQKLQGRKCLAARSVQKFRAGSVSRPYMVRGRKCLGAWK